MYVATDSITRWLLERGVYSLERSSSETMLSFRGACPLGAVRLDLKGITPTSLYTSGDFVPLMLRLDIGRRPQALPVLAVRRLEGALWQGAAAERYRGLVLTGLEPLSPLNRLTPKVIAEFLDWARDLVSSDLGRVRKAAYDATASTATSLRIWERMSFGWRVPIRLTDRKLRQRVGKLLRESKLFESVVERSGAWRGPVIVLTRFCARSETLDLELDLDLFLIDHPCASLALDEVIGDVKGLNSSAELVPSAWAIVRVQTGVALSLEEANLLTPLGPRASELQRSTYCCWLSARELRRGQLERLLAEVESRLRTRSAGPYR